MALQPLDHMCYAVHSHICVCELCIYCKSYRISWPIRYTTYFDSLQVRPATHAYANRCGSLSKMV